jgi:putative ABC transport system substrate-binding protein
MKKQLLAAILSAAMILGLTACGGTSTQTPAADTTAAAEETTQAADTGTADAEAAEDTEVNKDATADAAYTIGISQFAEHGSLDNCREGFLAGLEEEGIVEGTNLTVLFDNAQADTGTASTISDNYVSKKVNLICAIATPSAMSAYNSTMNTDIPVIYTAVSDPAGAGLANADGSPVGNITGTSDALAVDAQLKMIREILPDAKKIGILYTTSEANSVSTIEQYKEAAGSYGFEIVDSGINTIADVDLAAADLVTKVDCITNLTDNTVVSALQTVIAKATDAGIPVFGSEVEQVKAGCVASMGLEYFELGKQTGRMAAKVLKGEAKASEMNYEVISEPSLYVNTAAADKVSLALDDDFVASAYEKFDEIIVE